MQPDIVRRIAEEIGRVEEVDTNENGSCLGQFARARITRALDKPLTRCVSIAEEGTEDPRIILIRYECLPDFCYACGRVTHVVRHCNEEGVDKLNHDFGPWMRASRVSESRRQRPGRNDNRSGPDMSVTSRGPIANEGQILEMEGRKDEGQVVPCGKGGSTGLIQQGTVGSEVMEVNWGENVCGEMVLKGGPTIPLDSFQDEAVGKDWVEKPNTTADSKRSGVEAGEDNVSDSLDTGNEERQVDEETEVRRRDKGMTMEGTDQGPLSHTVTSEKKWKRRARLMFPTGVIKGKETSLVSKLTDTKRKAIVVDQNPKARKCSRQSEEMETDIQANLGDSALTAVAAKQPRRVQ